jgi:hypothetical protein
MELSDVDQERFLQVKAITAQTGRLIRDSGEPLATDDIYDEDGPPR